MSAARSAMSKVMKAIRVSQFGGTEVLKLQSDVPIPQPASNQVLIKIFTAGVNPVDTYIRSGTYARLPQLPYTPGNDCAGIVHDVGDAVKKFKKGERIYSFRAEGSYAEYAVVDEQNAFPLHDNISFSQGSGLGAPYFTAYRALFHRGNAKPGETVLIHGASGGVGIAACQLAHARGLRILGTAGSPEGLCEAKRNGADQVFNHREDGYTDKIMEATNNEGVDLILEMLANVNLETDLTMLKFHGRVVVVGNRGSIEINPRHTMAKESTITGCMLWGATPAEFSETASQLHVGADQGWLRPVVGTDLPLAQAAEAHHQVIHSDSKGKIILSMP